jgi:hypothetical protein
VVLALLAFGEAAPAAWPAPLSLDVRPGQVLVTVDGQQHQVDLPAGTRWQSIRFEQPGPFDREYQVDGTDLTFTLDRDAGGIERLQSSPLYRLDAWLRDEPSFSRWEQVRLADPKTGSVVAGVAAVEASSSPASFHLDAVVRRLEAPARLWLKEDGSSVEQGVEFDRDGRHVRWLSRDGGAPTVVQSWYFPDQPAPFAADLANLLGRCAAAGYVLVLAALLVGVIYRRVGPRRLPSMATAMPSVALVLLAGWLAASVWVTVALYHQLPHVLDAVSYIFQASVFGSGQLALATPEPILNLRGPFQVVYEGRWFSQYPPGAPAAYALGGIVGLAWLVGPLAGAFLIGATAWVSRTLYAPGIGLLTLALGVLSPFILFQAGSFLSHPIAGAALAAALACMVRAERDGSERWYALSGACLGFAFLTREAAALLFAVPLAGLLAYQRQPRALGLLTLGALPFGILYLGYNAALTGSPLLLPRTIFDARDRFGFGDGIGFYGHHTPAAGLVVADELLNLLQFDLFGWPPLFALGLLGLPFLLRRPSRWDVVAGSGALLFVVGHMLYFANGVALGPRYYYEALPWLLLLAARGLDAAVATVRRVTTLSAPLAWVGMLVVLGVLTLNTVGFYLPRQVARRTDFTDIPYTERARLPFVTTGLFGPRVNVSPTPALVVTGDWWLFNVVLSPLNCADLERCPVVFALASSTDDVAHLQATLPGRTLLRAFDRDGTVELQPE